MLAPFNVERISSLDLTRLAKTLSAAVALSASAIIAALFWFAKSLISFSSFLALLISSVMSVLFFATFSFSVLILVLLTSLSLLKETMASLFSPTLPRRSTLSLDRLSISLPTSVKVLSIVLSLSVCSVLMLFIDANSASTVSLLTLTFSSISTLASSILLFKAVLMLDKLSFTGLTLLSILTSMASFETHNSPFSLVNKLSTDFKRTPALMVEVPFAGLAISVRVIGLSAPL